MNQKYKAAITKSAKAIETFRAAEAAFKSKQIGQSEFLTARNEYAAAILEFDKAFATWCAGDATRECRS